MGRTTQSLYRTESDSLCRFSDKGEEGYITDIDPLLRIEDALTVEYFMKDSEGVWD